MAVFKADCSAVRKNDLLHEQQTQPVRWQGIFARAAQAMHGLFVQAAAVVLHSDRPRLFVRRERQTDAHRARIEMCIRDRSNTVTGYARA